MLELAGKRISEKPICLSSNDNFKTKLLLAKGRLWEFLKTALAVEKNLQAHLGFSWRLCSSKAVLLKKPLFIFLQLYPRRNSGRTNLIIQANFYLRSAGNREIPTQGSLQMPNFVPSQDSCLLLVNISLSETSTKHYDEKVPVILVLTLAIETRTIVKRRQHAWFLKAEEALKCLKLEHLISEHQWWPPVPTESLSHPFRLIFCCW